MRWTDIDEMSCSVAKALSVIGDRWSMLIIRDAFYGVRRFEAFQSDLGLTSHRLAERLRKLVEQGIFRRVQYEAHPPRFEYRLTEKGIDLYPILISLLRWGDRWMAGPDGAPIELVHRKCGHQITPALTCPECHEELAAREMSARPGPGLANLRGVR